MSDTVFITGASSGIGRAAGELFARRSWNVIATMRRPEAGADLLQLGMVTVLPVDVTVPETIQSAVDRAIAITGVVDDDIDVAVERGLNKAGATAPGPEIVADAIYQAATDESPRLRYSPNARAILGLRKVLPDAPSFGVVRRAVMDQ